MKNVMLLLMLIGCFVAPKQALVAQDAKQVLNKSIAAIDNAKTLKYRMKFKERLVSGWNVSEVSTKLYVKPFKVYIKTIAPDKDIEMLYCDGSNGGKCKVKPNGFPYVNVNLHPTSSHIMKTQHHPPTDSGFQKFKKLMQSAMTRAGADFDKIAKVTGSTSFDGKDCYILQINDPTFAFTNYTVKSGQSLYDIAREKLVAEYMILENNKGVDDFFDIKTGQVLKIPTSYSKKTTLYIDKKTNMPIYQKMEDNKGLFEEYEIYSLVINPTFAPNEFTEDYVEYGF
jgi:outer membrane lipoprotein-sorting protein